MKTPDSNKISFDRLTGLFQKKTEHVSVLEPDIGEGYVQIFDLEKGLQARFWDCSFNESMEMFSNTEPDGENTYFNLAFFLTTEGIQFAKRNPSFVKSAIFDTLFISASSPYNIYVAAFAKCRCLSISFSEKWLANNVFAPNKEFEKLEEKLFDLRSFSLLESMNASEKKMVEELFAGSGKKLFGSFYIKSSVLRIISDFFYKIKERDIFNFNSLTMSNAIAEVEKYLSVHVTMPLPVLKELADKLSVSESTLKRHFKKKFGVNMSTYFLQKKMEYAHHLINEKNKSVAEAAHILGYRNIHHFTAMLKKHVR